MTIFWSQRISVGVRNVMNFYAISFLGTWKVVKLYQMKNSDRVMRKTNWFRNPVRRVVSKRWNNFLIKLRSFLLFFFE